MLILVVKIMVWFVGGLKVTVVCSKWNSFGLPCFLPDRIAVSPTEQLPGHIIFTPLQANQFMARNLMGSGPSSQELSPFHRPET